MNYKLYYWVLIGFAFISVVFGVIYFEDWRAEKYADAVIKRIDGCAR